MNDTHHSIVEYSDGNVHFECIFLPRFRNLLYTIQARDTIYISLESMCGGRWEKRLVKLYPILELLLSTTRLLSSTE